MTIRKAKAKDGYLLLIPDKNGRMIETWISEYGTDTYVYAYFVETAEHKWIPVNTSAGIFPDIAENVSAYENKLAYYTYDDGLYTVTMLGNAYDEENNYIGINRNDAYLAGSAEDADFYTEAENGYFYTNNDNLYLKDTVSGKKFFDFGLEATEDTKVVVFDKKSNNIYLENYTIIAGFCQV